LWVASRWPPIAVQPLLTRFLHGAGRQPGVLSTYSCITQADTLVVYGKTDAEKGAKGITAFCIEKGMTGFR